MEKPKLLWFLLVAIVVVVANIGRRAICVIHSKQCEQTINIQDNKLSETVVCAQCPMIRWNMEKKGPFFIHPSALLAEPNLWQTYVPFAYLFIYIFFVRHSRRLLKNHVLLSRRFRFETKKKAAEEEKKKERRSDLSFQEQRNCRANCFCFCSTQMKQQQSSNSADTNSNQANERYAHNNNNFFNFVHCIKQFTHLLFSSLRPT